MSKKVKVLISVLVAVVLLTVGSAATVMAREKSVLAPEVNEKVLLKSLIASQIGLDELLDITGDNTTSDNRTGLLARVAIILGIPEEKLVSAFKQAQQEIREEAFFRFLDKAVAEGKLTPEEAAEIKEWWLQKPEALDSALLRRILGFIGDKWGKNAVPDSAVDVRRFMKGATGEMKEWLQQKPEVLDRGLKSRPGVRRQQRPELKERAQQRIRQSDWQRLNGGITY